uniref:dynein axonemal assembly factor 3-like isoform X1 n=1 Tax=Scatophagus argus TaxID=75038 RepID=UPI001ED82058|nr:dynein axonemal assembly factor 3-like isoform X1 [Scatophagus argus]XP_046233595.1 dynein axonemal assembly factor 3-like isoform X1 [Scatophagus argus]XP_046233596.1 dynein axonemal assembly factor 3-like isoform X1 [Scatophagus argus]XP_046233597.1 dynein axonemal assembly factor 3-like isoform X1 [Scatophagus argus]XP_046233598.1 dynein axonemal assembly factor 3-like isoform X1 [Scatophagus argus]
MSAGRVFEGVGCVTWWGFSPARDLLSMGPVRHEGESHVLLVGSSDPRHILKTIAGLQHIENLHVWVIENSMEVVARQLLLLYLALMPQESIGNNEKAEVFLEVFGNSEIRSQTDETLRHAASQLSLSVTDTLETPTHACLNTTLLKFKERDELVRIFKSWIQPQSSSSILMSKAWDYRVRQHLGTRYDSKRGCFDWDLKMKLHEKGCGSINKQQYVRWREQGLAFEMREGAYQITNPTLLSSRVFSQTGDKVAVRGYWGDIISSPYLAFGIETDDKSLLKTQNGQHIKTAQDISFANVQALFQSLSSRRGCPTTSQPDAKTEKPSPQTDRKSVTINDLMHLNGICVTFLPMDSLNKLLEKKKYSHLFSAIYFSASCVHQLGPMMRQIAAPDAVLIVELAKYILDLNKEQEADLAKKVASIALDAEFEPWHEGKSDGVHAVFVPLKK